MMDGNHRDNIGKAMPSKLDPLISEFDTAEEQAAYERWYRTKVEKAMNSPHPPVPHEQVMASVRQVIEAARKRRHSA